MEIPDGKSYYASYIDEVPKLSTIGTATNGTGGLLIIKADKINNTGKILSNGSNGGKANYDPGGSSGGGSINIFYTNDYYNKGIYQANGGIAVTANKSDVGYRKRRSRRKWNNNNRKYFFRNIQ